MSCHSSALTHCHKLIQFSVTTFGAFAPDFLLYSTNHFMVSYKSHHMFVYQPFLLLIRIHQRFFTVYIPTGVYRLHGVLEPASRKVRTTFTETEPMQI